MDSLWGTGCPLQLPLDLIDEDPLQPRADNSPGFLRPACANSVSPFDGVAPRHPYQCAGIHSIPAATSSTMVPGAFAQPNLVVCRPFRLSWTTTTTKPTRSSKTCTATI